VIDQPPRSQTGLNRLSSYTSSRTEPSSNLMRPAPGQRRFLSFCIQQCHFSRTPYILHIHTSRASEGRIEKLQRQARRLPVIRVVEPLPRPTTIMATNSTIIPPRQGQPPGGADPNIVDEFIRYVPARRKWTTSPIAARYKRGGRLPGGRLAPQGNHRRRCQASIPEVAKVLQEKVKD